MGLGLWVDSLGGLIASWFQDWGLELRLCGLMFPSGRKKNRKEKLPSKPLGYVRLCGFSIILYDILYGNFDFPSRSR